MLLHCFWPSPGRTHDEARTITRVTQAGLPRRESARTSDLPSRRTTNCRTDVLRVRHRRTVCVLTSESTKMPVLCPGAARDRRAGTHQATRTPNTGTRTHVVPKMGDGMPSPSLRSPQRFLLFIFFLRAEEEAVEDPGLEASMASSATASSRILSCWRGELGRSLKAKSSSLTFLRRSLQAKTASFASSSLLQLLVTERGGRRGLKRPLPRSLLTSSGMAWCGGPSPEECRRLRSLLCGPGSGGRPSRTPGGGVICARGPECVTYSTSSPALAFFSPRRAVCCSITFWAL